MAIERRPDPWAVWFRRHRTPLAGGLWLLLAAGGIPDLLEGTRGGTFSFAYRVVFCGILCWTLGSRQDRSRAATWRRFASAWTALLALQLGVTTLALGRGSELRFGWYLGIAVVAFLAAVQWDRHRRIAQGQPWPPVPRTTSPETE